MPRLLFVLVVFCIVSRPGVAAAQTATPIARATAQIPVADVKSLQTAEKQWLDALYSWDAEMLDRNASADFVAITPSGRLSKTEMLNTIHSRATAATHKPVPQTYSVSNENIRVYGDVAVVTNVSEINGGGDNPMITPGRIWVTEVWHREAGVWKIVHLHTNMLEHGM